MYLVSVSSMPEQQVEHFWTVVLRCQEGCRVSICITLDDIGSGSTEKQFSQFDVIVVNSKD